MVTKNYVRIFTSLFSIFVILAATSSVTLAFSGRDAAVGEIVVSGNSDGSGSYVILDGQKAYNGRTFISAGTIKTEDAAATVRLKNLGSIAMAPRTTLKLDLAANVISGTLSSGNIKVANYKGVKVDLETADSKISNDGSQKNVFGVNLDSGVTQATAEIGSLTVNNGSNSSVLTPKQDDDDSNSALVPLLIFAGIVAVAVIFVLKDRDSGELGNVSPVI